MQVIALALMLFSTLASATIKAPGLSDRHYRYLALANELKVFLISDPTTDKAAASMDVYTGTNDDPEDFPGLAHFLEHMLFLGTDKFPDAGDFQQFISDQAGSNNAFTAPEHTNYFFSVNPKALSPALDRFSRFFIAPTFDPDYVDREINAVHAEYQSKLRDPARLSFEATKQGLNPRHPLTRFGAGNLDTLKKLGLIDALRTFYDNEYSANRMALVVLGEESLDDLEAMVRERFADVPNHGLPKGAVNTPLFDQKRLPFVVQSQPITESRQLTLLFPVPDTEAFTGTATLRLIGHLIGHEGKMSLLTYLKEAGYANGLVSGESIAMTDSRSFSISVSLTAEGFANRDHIIEEIFKTIRLIEQHGIEKWRFDELKMIAEASYRFEEESDPQSLVTYLSEKLHRVPAHELFTRGRLLTRYNPELVRDILTWLVPEQMLIRVVAPEVEPTETTQYYPTPINRFSLEKHRLTRFKVARSEASSVVKLPISNRFIADPGMPLPAVRRATIETQPHPLFIGNNAIAYVLTENRYGQPRSDLFIRLRTPLASYSPEATIMGDLLADAINEHLNSVSYNAALAGAGFVARASQSGITLEFSGFHNSLIPLVDRVLDALPIPLIDEATWTRLYQLKSQSLQRVQVQRPSSRLFGEMTSELMPLAYTRTELNEVLASIDKVTFHEYQKAFFSGFKAEVFLHGPVLGTDSESLILDWVGRLPLDENTPDVEITTSSWPGERSRSYKYEHPDQAAVVLYVDHNTDPGSRILNQLAGNLIEAPFYTRLRTEMQLGYITFSSAFPLFNTPVLAGVVQSPTVDPDDLALAIEAEFRGFADTVESMPLEQFESQRLSLLNRVMNPPSTQAELSKAIWGAIGLRRPFNDRMMQAQTLEALTKNQFIAYLRQRIQDPIILKAYRKDSS
jgi:secreted Zn-dependent insulinase-like peptidase